LEPSRRHGSRFCDRPDEQITLFLPLLTAGQRKRREQMPSPPFLSRLLVLATLMAVSPPGSAFADPAGPATDSVTGYRCLSASCTAVRLPNADCVCVKQNPEETDVRHLVLKCYTGHFGHWTSCPVKPRYGVVEDGR
jgi:hypothetical protein